MIEIQNLSKHYGQIRAADNVTFNVEKEKYLDSLARMAPGKLLL